MVPGVPVALLALGLTWPLCWQLAAVRRGFPAILAMIGLAQPVLHVVLEFGGALLAGTAGTHPGHGMTAAPASNPATAGAPAAPEMAAHSASMMTTMLLFHAVAALLTALVLARGERALCGLADAGRRVIDTVRFRMLVHCTGSARSVRSPSPRWWAELPLALIIALPARHGRRGPPATLGVH